MFARTLRAAPRCNVVQIRHKSSVSYRQLFKQPIFKSIFLTLVFGSVTIDFMRNKKNLEQLENTYNSKIMILQDIVRKLENGENLDITKELQLANALTRNSYNSVTDIEFDEQLEKFILQAGEDFDPKSEKILVPEPKIEAKKEIPVAVPVAEQVPAKKVDSSDRATSKFL